MNSPARPQESGTHTPSSRSRPTTLDIPGLTKSKVSPDGRIAQRDVGAKLVIVMVGLPARGKSYITKKIARYLNWLQHDTRIFNVGERRRVAAGASQVAADPVVVLTDRSSGSQSCQNQSNQTSNQGLSQGGLIAPQLSSDMNLPQGTPPTVDNLASLLPPPRVSITEPMESNSLLTSPGTKPKDRSPEKSKSSGTDPSSHAEEAHSSHGMDQSASFFDPDNAEAVHLREEVALATLDELLDYILDQNGSVGIFDATNSTLERRKRIMERVRQRAGPELGVLFVESLCVDENVRVLSLFGEHAKC